jgi:hypothetical protein
MIIMRHGGRHVKSPISRILEIPRFRLWPAIAEIRGQKADLSNSKKKRGRIRRIAANRPRLTIQSKKRILIGKVGMS